MQAQLTKAKAPYKYTVILNGDTRHPINFGASGYEDYTMHNDLARKINYIKRHSKREDWGDPYSKGFWSRWLLWNKPTIRESILDIRKQFGILVKVVNDDNR